MVKTAFWFRLRLRRLRSAYDLVKTRLSESEAEAEEPTNHKAWERALSLVYPSASAYDVSTGKEALGCINAGLMCQDV